MPNYKVCTFTPVTANASPLHGAADIFIVGIFQLLAPKLLFGSVMDEKLSFSAIVFPNRSLGTSSGGLFKGIFSND